MIAVVQTGGKQYTVQENDTIKVEKLAGEVGDTITFDEVLLTSDADGKKVAVGTPTVSGAKVTGKIVDQGRDKKVTVVKYKNKIRYKRTLGHRQHFTAVKIDKIAG